MTMPHFFFFYTVLPKDCKRGTDHNPSKDGEMEKNIACIFRQLYDFWWSNLDHKQLFRFVSSHLPLSVSLKTLSFLGGNSSSQHFSSIVQQLHHSGVALQSYVREKEKLKKKQDCERRRDVMRNKGNTSKVKRTPPPKKVTIKKIETSPKFIEKAAPFLTGY